MRLGGGGPHRGAHTHDERDRKVLRALHTGEARAEEHDVWRELHALAQLQDSLEEVHAGAPQAGGAAGRGARSARMHVLEQHQHQRVELMRHGERRRGLGVQAGGAAGPAPGAAVCMALPACACSTRSERCSTRPCLRRSALRAMLIPPA